MTAEFNPDRAMFVMYTFFYVLQWAAILVGAVVLIVIGIEVYFWWWKKRDDAALDRLDKEWEDRQ